MKKKTLLIRLILAAGFVLSGTYAFTNSGGGQTGLSGSPLSNGTCSNCHSGGAQGNQAISITTDIPSAGFTPNTNYTITVAASGSASNTFGYMASVEGSGQHQGTKTATNNQSSVNSTHWVNHTNQGTGGSGGSKQWSFTWNSGNAPDQTTIYAAVNFANGNGTTTGDLVRSSSLVLSKAPGVGLNEASPSSAFVYPNPAGSLATWRFSQPVTITEVKVYDLSGRLVKVIDLGRFAGATDELPLDLNGLAPGQYFLRATAEGLPLEAKVLKF